MGDRLGYRGKVFIRVEVRNYQLIDVIVYFFYEGYFRGI